MGVIISVAASSPGGKVTLASLMGIHSSGGTI